MSGLKLVLFIFLLQNLFINVSSTSSEGINTKIDIVKNFIDGTSDFTGISAINAPAKLVERLDSLKKLAGKYSYMFMNIIEYLLLLSFYWSKILEL